MIPLKNPLFQNVQHNACQKIVGTDHESVYYTKIKIERVSRRFFPFNL